MSKPRIYADFHNLDDSNRLRLTCAGTKEDLTRQSIELHEGLVLTFYMDDADDQSEPDELRTEGVVHYDDSQSTWVASVDWSAVRHASDEEKSSQPDGHAVNLRRVTIEIDGQNWFEVEIPAAGEEHFTPGNADFRFRDEMPAILRDYARKIASGEIGEQKGKDKGSGELSQCAHCGSELPPRRISVRLDGWKWLEFEIPSDQGPATYAATVPAILHRIADHIEVGKPSWDHGWGPAETVTLREILSAPLPVVRSSERRSG